MCLAVFIIGAIAYSQTPVKQENKIEPAAPFTMVTVEYRVGADGTKSIVGNRIRHMDSNGEWREMSYNPQTESPSKETAIFANTEDGVVAKAPDRQDKKFISKSPSQQLQECFRSVKCLSNQPGFVRMDVVAGLPVYVFRNEPNNPASPIEWIEESYSPRTGFTPLRFVQHFRDGSEIGLSEIGTEATKVEFKDVPKNLNDDLKEVPVRGQNKN